MSILNGIVLLDKPLGESSNQALQKVKRLLNADKIGHTGTLDPLATGMLPLCFGAATKIIEYMLNADKAYRTTVQLGVATETGDAEGAVTREQAVPVLTPLLIEEALQAFRGAILQTPPMYSALKHQGKPLYELARQGIEIERMARPVNIDQLTCVAYDQTHQQLTLEIRCSKGTYIRTLAEEIAKQLGTAGHLIALRRLYCAGFSASQMLTFEQLAAISTQMALFLLPVDAALSHWPIIEVSSAEKLALLQGKTVSLATSHSGFCRLYEDKVLLAVAELEQGKVLLRKFLM